MFSITAVHVALGCAAKVIGSVLEARKRCSCHRIHGRESISYYHMPITRLGSKARSDPVGSTPPLVNFGKVSSARISKSQPLQTQPYDLEPWLPAANTSSPSARKCRAGKPTCPHRLQNRIPVAGSESQGQARSIIFLMPIHSTPFGFRRCRKT